MKITFLGAAQEVTGSKYLIEHDNKKILVDCGLFQGIGSDKKNLEPFAVDPKTIQAVVLTHAHIDHTGYIPRLVKDGFKGKIFCSQGTYELCKILLPDCGAIQEEEAKKQTSQGNSVVPLYTKSDALKALQLFHTINFDSAIKITQSLQVTLVHSGHIIGSSFVILSDGKSTITFSGDLGRFHQELLKTPQLLKNTDYLVMESTYGDRSHHVQNALQILRELIDDVVRTKGTLIIPAFAVGRSQIILYYLYQLKQQNRLPNIPIFLDSPSAIHASNIMCYFPKELDVSIAECKNILAIAELTDTIQASKSINRVHSPMIIISASGMAEGGRILHHFKHHITDEKTIVLFVGFQAEGTLGYDLIHGAKTIKVDEESYNVHAKIKMIDSFSAHADDQEILDWLGYFEKQPKKVFITHGEIQSSQSLQQKIEKRFNWSVIIPKYLESFDLD